MTYDQVKLRKGMRKVCSKEEESELADLLKSGDVQMLEKWIIQLLDKVKRDPEVTPNSMRIFLQSIFNFRISMVRSSYFYPWDCCVCTRLENNR